MIIFKFLFTFLFSVLAIHSISRTDDYLLFSAEKGHFEHAKKALKQGAYVNVRDSSGKTPLMYAAILGNSDLVMLLILNGAGADFSIKDYEGKTALMYAIEKKHTKIMELLKSYGATE